MLKLKYPYHVCVIERFPAGAENRYFPMELLEIVEDVATSSLPTWLGNSLFREITVQETNDERDQSEDEHEFNQGREELSQDRW